jgi:hypothetical protein
MSLRALLLAVTATVIMAGSAAAQNVRLIGDYRDWSSYAASDGTGPVCFAMTKPKQVTPQPDGYTEGALYITNRPGEKIATEFNLVAGFAFQPDSAATVNVSGQVFNLFTQNDAAWLDDASQGPTLASAIRAGSTMVVEGTSAAGIKIVETFSLSGATAASTAIGDCS